MLTRGNKRNINIRSQRMTNSTIRICDQRRLRSACASAQSDRMCRLLPQAMQRGMDKNPCQTGYWVDVQIDLRLCRSHRSYCSFCCALAYFIIEKCFLSIVMECSSLASCVGWSWASLLEYGEVYLLWYHNYHKYTIITLRMQYLIRVYTVCHTYNY